MCIQLSLCAYYYHYVHTTVSMCILLSLCVYYCLYVYSTISILLPRNLCLKSEIKFLVAQGKKTWELKVNDYQITPSPIHVIARKRNGTKHTVWPDLAKSALVCLFWGFNLFRQFQVQEFDGRGKVGILLRVHDHRRLNDVT